jgi:hypothetical protein
MEKNNTNWENFGDVNPLDHGGIWIMQGSETCYRIVKFYPEESDSDPSQLQNLYVDISDDWIEKKEVMSCIGMTAEDFDPIWYAIGCTDYYSCQNFGCYQPENFETKEAVKAELEKYGITVE